MLHYMTRKVKYCNAILQEDLFYKIGQGKLQTKHNAGLNTNDRIEFDSFGVIHTKNFYQCGEDWLFLICVIRGLVWRKTMQRTHRPCSAYIYYRDKNINIRVSRVTTSCMAITWFHLYDLITLGGVRNRDKGPIFQ